MAQAPIYKYKQNGLEIAVWPSGDEGISIKLGSYYKDKEGNWKNSDSIPDRAIAQIYSALVDIQREFPGFKRKVKAVAESSDSLSNDLSSDTLSF